MSIQSEIIGALEDLEADLGMILIGPSGAEYPWVPRNEEVGTEIQVGPAVETIMAGGNVRKSHFVSADSTLITADSDVILADNSTEHARSGGRFRTSGFRGKTYRVLTVTEDPSGAYFYIRLGSAR